MTVHRLYAEFSTEKSQTSVVLLLLQVACNTQDRPKANTYSVDGGFDTNYMGLDLTFPCHFSWKSHRAASLFLQGQLSVVYDDVWLFTRPGLDRLEPI